MSDSRPPAAPPEPPAGQPDDAALTNLLTALPRTPAPAGFRDAVLAAIAADETDAEPPEAGTPAVGQADERPVPQVAPAVAPGPPSRWRRAAGMLAGLAMTAAALSGVAVLWSWSAGEQAAEMAVNEPASELSIAPAPIGEREGELRFDAAPLNEAAPADFADMEIAGMRDSDRNPDRDVVGLAADGVRDAPLAAASPRTLPEALLAEASDLSAVRVVRVQSPSAVSNQLAVLQFERTASRNAILPRLVEAERRSGGDAPARGAAEPGAPTAGAAPASADAESAEEVSAAEISPEEATSGPVGVLVMAQPDLFETTLREFRSDLAQNSATAGAKIADAGPLPRAAASELLAQSELSRELATELNPSPAAGANPDADPARGLPAPAATRPLGRGMGGGLGGGAIAGAAPGGRAASQPTDDRPTTPALGGFGGMAASGPADSNRAFLDEADRAGDALTRDGGFIAENAPFQIRVAPPPAERLNLSQNLAAKTSRAQRTLSEPGEPAAAARIGDSAEGSLNLRALPQNRAGDDRVPVLLLFEPPPAETAKPAAEPPR